MTPQQEIALLKADLAECRRERTRAEEDLDTMARELLALQESFSKLARSVGKTPGDIADVGRGDVELKRRRRPWWRRWFTRLLHRK